MLFKWQVIGNTPSNSGGDQPQKILKIHMFSKSIGHGTPLMVTFFQPGNSFLAKLDNQELLSTEFDPNPQLIRSNGQFRGVGGSPNFETHLKTKYVLLKMDSSRFPSSQIDPNGKSQLSLLSKCIKNLRLKF